MTQQGSEVETLRQRYSEVRQRLLSGQTPPDRQRRFIPVRPQSHRPDYVLPAPRVPMVLIDDAVRERVRDILAVALAPRIIPPDGSTWRDILAEVCTRHGVTTAEVLGPRRSKHIVAARHEAMYRMSKETTLSLPAIGMRMGGKDHSTVHHAITKYAAELRAICQSIADPGGIVGKPEEASS